ncbi:MAG: tetratricopeptide repeat protein [Limibacillus sp.]
MDRRPPLAALFLLTLALAFATAFSGPAQAQEKSRYARCLELAESAREFAFNEARLWREEDGDDWRADHCGGLALLLLDRPAEAAPWLAEARIGAGRAGEAPELRGTLAALEGQAWSLAGEEEKALEAQDEAIFLDPGKAEYYVDRAFSRSAQEDFWEALDDLNRAHELAPDAADVLALRASLYRRLEVPELALENAEEALTLSPNLPEGLLERALAEGALGNLDAARADLETLLRQAPDSPAAAQARRFLEQLN